MDPASSIPSTAIALRTSDGSFTLRSERFDEQYHSLHGAATESRHVFIEAGLRACALPAVRVLEVGLGTGLNALLTWQGSIASRRKVVYHALEPFPVPMEVLRTLDHPARTGLQERSEGYWRMMSGEPGQATVVDEHFTFLIRNEGIEDLVDRSAHDLIYMDAFAPAKQPELWSDEVFDRLFAALSPGGSLVTYCAKGEVRRTMQRSGFIVERLPGPPGKREMLRAERPSQ